MSNMHFFEDANNRSGKPKDEIQIEQLQALPYSDGFRVRVEVTVTPFQERPNLLLVLRDAAGETVNELDVIATMHAEMEFTMHLRNIEDPTGEYTLAAELFYETRQPPQDTASLTFTIPASDDA